LTITSQRRPESQKKTTRQKDVNTLRIYLFREIWMATEDNIKATIDELQKVLSANNIIGAPIEMEDKIVIPITKMGMGFGAGTGQGSNKNAGGTSSGGAGGGVGVFPVAVVIVFKGVAGPEGVKVVPLGTTNALTESLSGIASAIVGKLVGKKDSSEKKLNNAHATPIEVE
jgi:uncharacterized spore protein YtfJ